MNAGLALMRPPSGNDGYQEQGNRNHEGYFGGRGRGYSSFVGWTASTGIFFHEN